MLFVSVGYSQRHVDPRNSYKRVIAIVSLVGTGSASDPRRPEYAPWPVSQDPNGIIAFCFVPSDDGKWAIAEFVAQDRVAFQPLFNDKSIRVFEKGRSSKPQIETALQQYRKDFTLDKYGMVMP